MKRIARHRSEYSGGLRPETDGLTRVSKARMTTGRKGRTFGTEVDMCPAHWRCGITQKDHKENLR
jgi:hypothetical protein